MGSTYNGGRPRTSLSHLTPFQHRLSVRLWDKRAACRKKGTPFDLDVEWLEQQLPICAVTGVELTFGDINDPFAVHIDQIVPQGGYTKANVRLVAQWFNIAKHNFPDEVIKKIIIDAAARMSAVKE